MPTRQKGKKGTGKAGKRAKSGNELKKQTKGVAANYVTRTQAIRKLQITLRDFRRLCILKGIYPRDPKKKKSGRDKTYYHVKDIKFLSHEPLLQKFRDLKAFVKKFKKAQHRHDKSKADKMQQNRPRLFLDHLVKERYPSFTDALKDIDDALSMIFLFASIKSKTTKAHTSAVGFNCLKLSREWQNYVFHTQCLSKVFVSIKGIYFQAVVQSVPITWLVPHKFTHPIPNDVDYRVMLTFLTFYQTALKFVNFKLYHEIGLHYPPKLDLIKDAMVSGLQVFILQTLSDKKKEEEERAKKKKEEEEEEEENQTIKKKTVAPKTALLQKDVNAVVAKLTPEPIESTTDTSNKMDVATDEVGTEEKKVFSDILQNVEMSAEEKAFQKGKILFSGLTFLLSRETPMDALEFVILCGGGKVLREYLLKPEQVASTTITHQVVDRADKQQRNILSREYIQPQWVFDAFNVKALIPVEPYAPGKSPPPHLSPFVDHNQDDSYVPKQALVLAEWGAISSPAVLGLKKEEQAKEGEEKEVDEDEEKETAEKKYQQELAQERAGITFSQKQQAQKTKEDDEEEGEGGEGEEEADEEEDEAEDDKEMEQESEEEGSDKEEKAAVAQPLSKAAKVLEEEKDLSKIMMPKKAKRLYHRMQYGIKAKQEKDAALIAKREKIEKDTAKKRKSPPSSVSVNDNSENKKKNKKKKKKATQKNS